MADTLNPDYDKVVADAYATIGRTGVGDAVSNVDQGGLDYWKGQLASGALTPDNFKSAFDNAVDVYKRDNPDDKYTKYVESYWDQQSNAGGLPTTTSAPASNNYFTANPDVAAAYTANSYGMTPDQFAQQHYNNYGQNEGRADPTAAAPVSAPTPDYNQIVTDAYGTIGRTGIGADASNVDQAGLDYWKGELAAGRIKPEEFSSVFGNAVRQYKIDNPNDTYTQYVNNYQLGQTTDPMKTGLTSVFADDKVSWEEANQINDFYSQYGFKPEDIARVTGFNLDKVNEALGARGNYIGQNIAANLDNPVGLVDYAQENKLTAKDLASASGGVLSEAAAQALMDKGSTYAGKVELQSPETYSQIKGIINRAVNKDYGKQESDWMYKMFTGLSPEDVSLVPKKLDFTERKTDIASGVDENGNVYEYERELAPATVKNAGIEPVYETNYGDDGGGPVLTGYRQKVDSASFGDTRNASYATYDTNGTLTGFESGSRIHTSDPDWIQGRWDAEGKATPYAGRNQGGGFIKGLGNDVAGFTESLGPLWTAAKIAFPELNLVDVGADVARSEVNLNTGVKAAVGTAGVMDADAANAVSGLDGGNAVMNTAQLNTANNLKLGATAVTAAQAAEQGNYTPLLTLGANVAGINKMPEVAASMNVLTAANAIANNDPSGLMNAAGNLTGSKDLKLAGSATRLIKAIESGDQAAIAVAGMAFSSAVRTNTGSAVTTLKDAVFGPKNNVAGVDLTDLSEGVQVAGPGGLDQGGFKPGTPTQTASGMFFTTPDGTTYPVTVNKETGMMTSTDPVGAEAVKQFKINDTSGIKDIFFDKTTLNPNLSAGETEALKKVTGKSSGDITDVEAKNASPEVKQQAQDLGNTLLEKIKGGASMGDMLRMIGGLDTAENATALYLAKQMPELRAIMDNAQNSGYVRELEDHLATDPTDANWLQEYKGITGKDYTLPSAGEIVITGSRIVNEDGTSEGAGEVVDAFTNPYTGIMLTTQVDMKTGAETITEIDPTTKITTQTITTPTTVTQVVVDPITTTQTKTITDLESGASTTVKIDTKTGAVTVLPPSGGVIGDAGGDKDKAGAVGDAGGDKDVVADTTPTTPTKPTTPTTPAATPAAKPSVLSGGASIPLSGAGTFLPPEPGKFKKISEDFTPLNPMLFALAGVGPLKGTLEERLDDKEEEPKKKMPTLAEILFTPAAQTPSTPMAQTPVEDSTPEPQEEEKEQIVPAYAQGGLTGMHPMGEPQFYSQGGLGSMHVQGDGDGTSDSVPAMVAKDEFVLPADVVSSLGNGSSEAGASVLDQFVEIIRQHKHSNQPSELPPQSKGPLEYLSSAMKKGHA